MTDVLDLRKQHVLDLAKRKGINATPHIILALDYSGSMNTLYHTGVVQQTVERILPIGMALGITPDVDFFLFDDSYRKLQTLTRTNIIGFIDRKVLGHYDMGGTKYSPVMEGIARSHNIDPKETEATKKPGFWGKLFGAKEDVKRPLSHPIFVIFITDGESNDTDTTRALMINLSYHGIFWQFVGIGRQRKPFLEQLDKMGGRYIDNANFFNVPDLSNTTDDQLYNLLLNEFPSWISQARTKNLIL